MKVSNLIMLLNDYCERQCAKEPVDGWRIICVWMQLWPDSQGSLMFEWINCETDNGDINLMKTIEAGENRVTEIEFKDLVELAEILTQPMVS